MTGWEQHYAIRMPNGDLYSQPGPPVEAPPDYSVPSPMRDMGMFGFLFGSDSTPTKPGPMQPVIFTNQADAEKKLNYLREQAAQFGVTHWGGEIVHRVCTPFTAGQLAGRQFVEGLHRWMKDNMLLPPEGGAE